MNRGGGTDRGAQQQFYINYEPVGSEKVIRPNASWEIATIEIDNPTGRWLYIEPISDYIAPYTIGIKRELRPRTVDIRMMFVDPPAGGGVNVDDGGQISLLLHDDYLGEDSGLTYKIATDTDKIVNAIRSLREGWGDLALEQDQHIIGGAGGIILPDTGNPIAISYATVTQDGPWRGGGLQGFVGFSLYFSGGPNPPVWIWLAYPDQASARFRFPPRFYGLGDLESSVMDSTGPSPMQQSWSIDVWYREII